MNEEAMTPDKEQVVEPLNAALPCGYVFGLTGATCGSPRDHTLHRPGSHDAKPTTPVHDYLPTERRSSSPGRRTLDAARTASVAGLEHCYGCIGYRDHGDGSQTICEGVAPSIEQEPGEHRLLFPPHPDGFHVSSALCSCGDWQYDHDTTESLLAAQQDVRRDHVAHIRAALREQEPGEAEYDGHSFYEDPVQGFAGECDYSYRNGERCGHDAAFHWHEREQEPGETLRAADLRRALRANRHAPDIARDPMANQWNRGIDRALEIVDRLALEADRNPQETER